MSRAWLAWGLLLCGCRSSLLRPAPVPTHEYPAGVAQMRWRTVLHEHTVFEASPEECAQGALVGSRLVLGSRAGQVAAVDTVNGRIIWSTPISGAVDSEALYDVGHGQVYVGSDDGYLYAIEPSRGTIRWAHKAKGSVDRRPALGKDTVYVSTAGDRVVALDAATGKWRWQYDREIPEGFTIHGYSGPLLARDTLFVGFTDGYLVALRADSGEVKWSRSLASASEQFVDVDTTPVLVGDNIIAASYSGGLYSLRANDGEVVWRLGTEGVTAVTAGVERLNVGAPRDGLAAVTFQGNILWRQGASDAGDLTAPREVGPYLIFSGSRAGLFIVDRASGKLLQIFDPGRGMCAPATIDEAGRQLYVLANSGTLYAMSLIW